MRIRVPAIEDPRGHRYAAGSLQNRTKRHFSAHPGVSFHAGTLSVPADKKGVQMDVPTHVFSFPLDRFDLGLHIHTDSFLRLVARFDTSMPNSVLNAAASKAVIERFAPGYPFGIGLDLEKIAALFPGALTATTITNAGYNKSCDLILRGTLISNNEPDSIRGQRWYLVKTRDGKIEPRIIDLDSLSAADVNSAIAKMFGAKALKVIKEADNEIVVRQNEEIADIEFGLPLYPLIVDGTPLTSMLQAIPGVGAPAYSLMTAAINHFFWIPVTGIIEQVGEHVREGREEVLADILHPAAPFRVLDHRYHDFGAEIETSQAMDRHKQYAPGSSREDLLPGQYLLDEAERTYSVVLRRAAMAHDVMAITADNRLVVAKFFGGVGPKSDRDYNSGVYMEHIGPLVCGLTKRLLGTEAVFGGSFTQSGDTRSAGPGPGGSGLVNFEPTTGQQTKEALKRAAKHAWGVVVPR
ncbi:hypothetical protein ACFL31_02600 [Candidatus Margulisiibacteriota bacterium]